MCQRQGGRNGEVADTHDAHAAHACITQAEKLAAPAPLRLIITHGLSGCGKTVASSQTLQRDPHARTLRVRSDVERKRLHGLARSEHSGSGTDTGIYTADAHARTYQRLADLARTVMQAGWSVVVDAAFLKRSERDTFRTLAREYQAQFAILDPDVLRERIVARQRAGQDASEATVEVLERQRQWIEPLQDDELALRLDVPQH